MKLPEILEVHVNPEELKSLEDVLARTERIITQKQEAQSLLLYLILGKLCQNS